MITAAVYVLYAAELSTQTYLCMCIHPPTLRTPVSTFQQMLEETMTTADLVYPVPWATEPSQSFATHPRAYLEAAALAGFDSSMTTGPVPRREEGQAFVQNAPAAGSGGPPPLSLPKITFGLNGMAKMKNILSLIRTETIFPCEMIFKKNLED
jgi:hypothetical protein